MQLIGLWRYPVKSMQGESLETADVVASGIAGDRRYGVQAVESGRILSAKREGRLLSASATGAGQISLPTGESLDGPGDATDAALSAWLERPVHLVEACTDRIPTFESQLDAADDASESVTWEGRPEAFVDSSPIHLLTTATLRAVATQRPDIDWRMARFRPNLVVDALGGERVEDGWVGQRCSIGVVQLEIIKPCERCVMVTRRQPGGVERELGVLTHLAHESRSTLGVLARVVRTGTVSVGAPVTLD